MAVLMVEPFLQFFDANGDPLAGGKIYTYAAGTTTPKATFSDESGTIELANPVILDSAGRATVWIAGSYKFVVKDSFDNIIKTTDNVTAFTTSVAAAPAYFQSFSGTGSQTAFTTSDDLGTDEKALMVFVGKSAEPAVSNGDFATDTIWTKGAGWTIAAGVATAAGAISTAISQTAIITLTAGYIYSVTYTITRSAGGLIPSIGGNNGTERVLSGTYREVIVAGTTQTIAFTGNAFTGTLDNVSVITLDMLGMEIQPPTAYTINGTTLTFAVAPPTGTNNVFVFAPSLLLGAAASSAASADASATAASNSASAAAASAIAAAAASSARINWDFSSTTTMADPGTGFLRLNNTPASATAMAISNLSSDTGNPDLSAWIATWDDSAGSPKGGVYLFKDNSNFAIYNITGTNVDNAGWKLLTITYMAGNGTLTNLDSLYIGFTAYGSSTVIGGITALTSDVTASGSGSVSATIAPNAVTNAKAAQMPTLTVKSNITGGTANAADNSLTSILDAAVGSTQGSIMYRNASVWTPLAPGTSGQLLTSGGAAANPSWTTVSSGGSYTLLATRTASASTTLDFLSVLTSAYDSYVFFVIDLVVNTNSNAVAVQYSINNSTFIASNYAYTAFNGVSVGSVTPVTSMASTSTTMIPMSAANMTSGAADGASGFLTLLNTNSTTTKKKTISRIAYGSGTEGFDSWGNNTTLSAVNAIRFLPSAGGNFTSGKILCYGIKNT